MTDEERGRDAADEPNARDATDDAGSPANDDAGHGDDDSATDPAHDSQPMTADTTDTDRTTTAPDRTESDRDAASDHDAASDDSATDRLSPDGLRGLLDRVGLAALSLLAVVAGWGFYSQSANAIRIWFDSGYQSVALAVFNLAVLLVALAGVTHQLRQIRAGDRGEPTE
ncbi:MULTISPECIES: hypothetical protein [Halorubrum]|uniref:DUF8060 domain-containing protein n=1 Tax=Halorubrum hochstenium ATCC 700873 TaxID=1227481 RepID=M0F6X5_9EURY|nr:MULTISPECIES: hypothetical protein [Halorubrum]ELZ55048.1 hypothetical protein C467_09991 [Halorubrum hochstenium ATCC 700873]